MDPAAQGDIGIQKFHDATEKTYVEKLKKKNKYYWIPKDILDKETVVHLGSLLSESIIEENYIGSGSFGGVSICKVDGIRKKCIMKTMCPDALLKDIEDLEAELEILDLASKSKGKYICKMYFAGFNQFGSYMFILESLGGGTLGYHIRKKSDISPAAIKVIAYQLAKAIDFLHGNHRTHGDLKPDNIGLTARGHVKLFDFGKSRNITSSRKLPRGTLYYDAPELIEGNFADESIDWWSYGCVVAELIQKKILYQDREGDKYVESLIVFCSPNLQAFDDETKNFLLQLLEKNPDKRLKEVRKHAFFKDLSSEVKPLFFPCEYLSRVNLPTPWKTPAERIEYYQMPKDKESAIINASLLRYPTKFCTKFMNQV